jgi:hypothetical protein
MGPHLRLVLCPAPTCTQKKKPNNNTHVLHSTRLTNYFEEKPGSVLSRDEVYAPYVAHCKRMHYEHTTLSVFAKLFKVLPASVPH